MSITFTPTAGTWTARSYYPLDENACQFDLDRAVNGVISFESDEPHLQCHNSGGLWLVETFTLVPDFDDDYCGSFPAEHVAELLARVQAAHDATFNTEYEGRKLRDFADLLLHCRYHNCGFTWG